MFQSKESGQLTNQLVVPAICSLGQPGLLSQRRDKGRRFCFGLEIVQRFGRVDELGALHVCELGMQKHRGHLVGIGKVCFQSLLAEF